MPTAAQLRSRDLRAGIAARTPRPVSLVLVIGLLLSCSHHRDPAAAFAHARETYRHGDIAAAGKEAEEGYREFHATSAEWAWQFIIFRAKVLYRRGKGEEALKLLASGPGAPPSIELAAQRKRLESDAYASLHRFAEAERKLAEAEAICTASDCSACGDLASAYGGLEMGRGNYAKAHAHFERALGSARSHGDRFLESIALLNLSWSASEQTHFDEVLDQANLARQIGIASDYAGIAQGALGNMGWAYYKLGDPEKARAMFMEAAGQAERLGDAIDQINWLTNAGYTYMDEGAPSLAEQSFRQSLDLASKISSWGDIMDARTALAIVSEQTGKLDDAKRNADEALAIAKTDGNGRDIVYALLVEGRIAARRSDTAAAEAAFHQVEQSADTPVFLKWEAERSLARLYEDEDHSDSADREYRIALSTFEAARCGLHERVDSRLPFLSNAARIYEDYIHFLVSRGKTNEALQVADYARARTLAEGLGRPCKAMFAPDPLNAPEIAWRAGGIILFYALGQEHSYLWAITPHRVRLFPLTANQSDIDGAVERYRKKIEGPREILEASNDGSVLYQMLITPAQDFLKKEVAKNGNVFIIPDGGLNSLNFETLVPETQITETPLPKISSAQPKRYWIEDVTIVNAASLRLLPTARGRSRIFAGRLLLMGNPVVADAGPGNAYPELPNADSQMKNIEKYFPSERQEIFVRAQASPAAYLNSHPEQFSYIHFVAHGTASRMDPLDSAIILSREPESNPVAAQDDSFKLYARDIINGHPLRAELVTISACYSTGNRTYSGEGLVGLSWAFLRAGAHNVIGALWDVSDASTSQLVDEFYSELKKGKSPGAALRTAKLSLLHNGAFRNPFYWAPFQLYTGS
jgi:CHAT domain-containing protein/tetratricopeptide (TPR) repeat protein